VDLAFPEVPPEAGLDDLRGLARETLALVPEGVAVSLVSGEYVLTQLLVQGLQRRGGRCVAATTVRRVEDRGGGQRVVEFEFVRFRDYPPLPVRPAAPDRSLVDPAFSEATTAEALHEQARRTTYRVLVAIPSNTGALAGAVLSWRPKHLLLLRTRGLNDEPLRGLAGWLEAWPFDWKRPHLHPLPEGAEEGLLDEEVLPNLREHRLLSKSPDKHAYLVTGGLSQHTALLTRHAEAAGSAVVHFQARYRTGERVADCGHPTEIPVPVDVLRTRALSRARRLLRDRAFSAARDALDALKPLPVPDTDVLVSLTRTWIDAWRLRDAMLWEDADRVVAEQMQRLLLGVPRSQQKAQHKALDEAASRFRDDLEEIRGGAGEDEVRLGLLAELLVRADQEHRGERRNHAALLLYRAAEACVSERLRVGYGIDPGEALPMAGDRWPARWPRGHSEPFPSEQLEARWADVHRPPLRAPALAAPLGLAGQLQLLAVLEDPVVAGWPDAMLHRLRELGSLRNRSLFAHGFQPVASEDLAELRGLVAGPALDSGAVEGLVALPASRGEDLGRLRRLARRFRGPHLSDDGTRIVC